MALYRKYRPGSFTELLGQEQVTVPLSRALDQGRINHAYLFSGPRGCGKTSSARILARSLNCEQGPTSTPCGVCESCVALAPNGSGTLDVTELDAASHNGVEDMRELRDKAAYAPADSRYRIFIIDEAHMITSQGANALLKVVEEPPEHLIFIFATTEPEKVIPTIRSRVHHYPFRLLTPQAMRELVERTVASEGVKVEDSVYPMVIRAGGGSPRDTLSILDQLLAGTGPEGLTYSLARMLLGVTDDALIDASAEALAESDATSLFTTIDNVIEAGLEPRRFASDLLDRLRDLMLIQAVPDALELGLVDAPTDRAEILRAQAAMFQPGRIPALATLLNESLASLKGATSPRLLLEVLCAKMLQPVAPVAGAGALPAAGSAAPAAGLAVGSAAASAAPAEGTILPKYERRSVRMAREKAQREAQAASSVPSAEPQATPAPAPVSAAEPQTEPAPEVKPEPVPSPEPAPSAEPQATPAPAPAPEPTGEKEGPGVGLGTSQSESSEPQPASADLAPVDAAPAANLDDAIAAKWERIGELLLDEDDVAGILLSGAKFLGTRGTEVVIGHNTGALVAGLNSPQRAAALKKVLSAELGTDVSVSCVVGTDRAAHGFAEPAKTEVWAPGGAEKENDGDESEEGESHAGREGSGERESSAAEQPVAAPPAPVSPAPAPADPVWGEPSPIGQDLPQPAQPRVEPPKPASAGEMWAKPAPIAEERQEAPSRAEEGLAEPARKLTRLERAQQAIANGAYVPPNDPFGSDVGSFGEDVPLPPEPTDWDVAPESHVPQSHVPDSRVPEPRVAEPHEPGPLERAQQAIANAAPEPTQPEPVPMTREEEEAEMIQAAESELGSFDRRDAMTVAMDLISQELGGRQI